MIDVVGNRIRSDIVAEVHQAQFYSVIADEVIDVANKEELSLALRYVFCGTVKEVFVDFIEVERTTGELLAESILNWLPLSLQLTWASAMMVHRICPELVVDCSAVISTSIVLPLCVS